MAKDLTWWKAAILAVRGGKLRRAAWTVDPIQWITHRTGLWFYHQEENDSLDDPMSAVTAPHVVRATEFVADDFTADDWTDEDIANTPTTPPGGGGGGTGGGDPPGGITPPVPVIPPNGGGGGGGTGEPPVPPGPIPPGGGGGGGDGGGGAGGPGPIPLPPGPGGGGGGGGEGGGDGPALPHDRISAKASWRSAQPVCAHNAITGELFELGGSAVFHCPEGTSWSITARYLGFVVSLGTKTVPLSLVNTGSRFDDERIGELFTIGSPYSHMFINTCPPFTLRARLLSAEAGVHVEDPDLPVDVTM